MEGQGKLEGVGREGAIAGKGEAEPGEKAHPLTLKGDLEPKTRDHSWFPDPLRGQHSKN